MSFFSRSAICFVAVLMSSAVVAQAQGQGGTGGGGTTTGGGGTGGGQASLGSSDTSVVQDLGTPEFGELSSQMGTGFIGQNAPETFVGGNQAAQQAGQRQARNFQQNAGGQNVNQQFNQNRQVTQSTGTRAIRYRAPHVLAFNIPRQASRDVNLSLTSNLSKLSNRVQKFSGVSVAVSENVVTMSGTVSSESERQLALLYMQMEPGVDKVVDQLSIVSGSVGGQAQE